MPSKRADGEGSIYRRADGRWGASAFVDTANGKRKRIHIYGRTRQEVHDRITEKLAPAQKGIRTPDRQMLKLAFCLPPVERQFRQLPSTN